MSRETIAVFGAGSWGTALAVHLQRQGVGVRIWVHSEATLEEIRTKRENTIYLPGVPLARSVFVTGDAAEALSGVTGMVLAVPSRYVRTVLETHAEAIEAEKPEWILSAVKGIEQKTIMTMSHVIRQEIHNIPDEKVAVLSGPSFARELADRKPTAVVIAALEANLATHLQALFNGGSLRVYRATDRLGVELGGALKNVISLGAGIVSGKQLGHNALAALITRGLAEMVRFGVAMKARPETFFGLSGLGDLVLTCTGPLSRNRQVGYRLGLGQTLESIMTGMVMAVEGIPTVAAVYDAAQQLGVDMPIVAEVKAILYDGKPIHHAVQSLLERPLTTERRRDATEPDLPSGVWADNLQSNS